MAISTAFTTGVKNAEMSQRLDSVVSMEVEVIRSARRRRTASLTPTVTGVRISVPASASRAEQDRLIQDLLRRHQKRRAAEPIDLLERCRVLSTKYGLEMPSSIRWVENQKSRWGSCTPAERSIRISSSVAEFPLWVIDYVLVHELAHLSHADHGSGFWSLVKRYPKAERARGYLIAKSSGPDEEGSASEEDFDGGSTDDGQPTAERSHAQQVLDFAGG